MTPPIQAQLIKVSKFLSFILRHKPQEIGIVLDSEGWVDIDTLIAKSREHDRYIDRETIELTVKSCDKQRFQITEDGQCIRAVQGHSTATVKLTYPEQIPPEVLYHGTATRFLESIWTQGLISRERHHVHLSIDTNTAIGVGRRHGSPFVFKVHALKMHEQGFKFYLAPNGVWLTEEVPITFLTYEAQHQPD